jgi:hypothetical protein
MFVASRLDVFNQTGSRRPRAPRICRRCVRDPARRLWDHGDDIAALQLVNGRADILAGVWLDSHVLAMGGRQALPQRQAQLADQGVTDARLRTDLPIHSPDDNPV